MTVPDSTTQSSVDSPNRGFGIDVGGSGVKGGIVDLDTGQLIGDRFKLLTPQPATPEAVAATIAEVARHFGWTGPLGVTYPGVITDGVVRTAANVDKAWIGTERGRDHRRRAGRAAGDRAQRRRRRRPGRGAVRRGQGQHRFDRAADLRHRNRIGS